MSGPLPLPHYVARQMGGAGNWGFTTPSGQVPGFMNRAFAQKCADTQRQQDMDEAYSNMTSPIATVLRLYFDSLTETEIPTPPPSDV